MASPPPKKVSVFIGRETLVDRDEVDKIRRSIEHEAGALTDAALMGAAPTDALTDAALGDWGEDLSNDGEGRDSPVHEEQASQQGSNKSQELAPLAPKKPRGRPRGGPRTPRKIEEARDRRRSGRIRSDPMETMALVETLKLMFNVTHFCKDNVSCFTATVPHVVALLWKQDISDKNPLDAPFGPLWRGFDAKHNTWELKRNLDKCSDAIVAYERSIGAVN
ncbi:guanine nucleotide exchange factor synembryn [Ophiocordyceps sinensis CO18]|uniref:Guanine nucleotide exchange factor synembryn n=1 Tax=Ophiocordyceps sinensis (strain Co18 / CGMCC 3.14243) TaxID=911162 RepID=T5AJK9_OPHSC|nr:guanine nucleotide exchange factor synembryn [Ophiocordyceps sinensis CO18]